MKKYLLIAVSAVFCLTASAQNALNAKSLKVNRLNEAPKAVRVSARPVQTKADLPSKAYVVNSSNLKAERKAAGKRAESTLDAYYEKPVGSLYWGMDADWGSYYVVILQTHAINSNVVFPNYSSYDETQPVEFLWTRSGATTDVEMEQDEEGNGIGMLWGYSYYPILTATQGTESSTYTFETPNAKASTKNAYWYAGMDEFNYLTNACPGINVYSGFTDAGGYSTQTEFYGADGKKAIGLASYFDAPNGVIYTDTILVNGWFEAEYPAGTTVSDILGDNDLYATIYTFDENGDMVEFAKAICNKEYSTFDAEYASASLQFVFEEEDPLFGSVAKPIVLPQEDFMVVVSGFENISAPFTCPMTAVGSLGYAGHAYAVLEDGSFATIGYSNYPSVPQCEIFIQFHAIEAVAVPAEYNETIVTHDIVKIPAEGGYGITYSKADGTEDFYNYEVYTDSPIEEWSDPEMSDESMYEWLKVTYNDQYMEEEGVMIFYFSADALPAGVEGRGGYVTLSLYGNKLTIPVTQGNFDITGVKGVKADVTNNHSNVIYNLAGQRVNADFKGLVIKNGKKMIQK